MPKITIYFSMNIPYSWEQLSSASKDQTLRKTCFEWKRPLNTSNVSFTVTLSVDDFSFLAADNSKHKSAKEVNRQKRTDKLLKHGFKAINTDGNIAAQRPIHHSVGLCSPLMVNWHHCSLIDHSKNSQSSFFFTYIYIFVYVLYLIPLSSAKMTFSHV